MSDIAKTLSEATADQLIDELLKRPGIVTSIWNIEDVRSFIEDSDEAADLTDEQKEAACDEFLSQAAKGLRDHLGSQGNNYLLHLWEREGADILKGVTATAPSA